MNGTSVGVHAALLASCRPGDAVVLARNSHACAVAACVLSGARPFFADVPVCPQLAVAHCCTPEALGEALAKAQAWCDGEGARRREKQPGAQTPRVALALVVSPSYFGACADVTALAAVAHGHAGGTPGGVPLCVDEAHGAHFAFAPQPAQLPPPALACGADLAVQSTHKTLGALTQASMLHAGAGCRVPASRLSAALLALQSSSPSYLLLASLDCARAQAGAGSPGAAGVAAAVRGAAAVRAALARRAPQLLLLSPDAHCGRPGVHALDVTRLTVGCRSLGCATGWLAQQALSRLGVACELAAHSCVVLVLGGGNEGCGDGERLVDALVGLHARALLSGSNTTGSFLDHNLHSPLPPLPAQPAMACAPRTAFFAARETVALALAAGRVSAETLCPYPPVRHSLIPWFHPPTRAAALTRGAPLQGIPVAFPGGVLAEDALRFLEATLAWGGKVTGAADPSCQTLQVVARGVLLEEWESTE